LAWVVDADAEIVLIGQGDEDARRAASLAAAVGLSPGALLAGGMRAWMDQGRALERIERLRAAELSERCARSPGVQIVDVRDVEEWGDGHIPGSLHVPYRELRELPGGLDPGQPIAVICASGNR